MSEQTRQDLIDGIAQGVRGYLHQMNNVTGSKTKDIFRDAVENAVQDFLHDNRDAIISAIAIYSSAGRG